MIKNEKNVDLWSELTLSSMHKNESKDCAVRAIAIACGVDYNEAHLALNIAGRKNRSGTWDWQINDAIELLGKSYKYHFPTQPNGCRYTPKTIGKWVDKNKTYIAKVRGHVLAVKGGVVVDWTNGRKHRIFQVWEIVQ